MTKKTLPLLCIALATFVSPASAEIVPRDFDPPPFVSQEGVESVSAALETKSYSPEAFDLPVATVNELARTIRSTLAFKRVNLEEGQLTGEGCFRYWPAHSEMRYASRDRMSRLEEMVEAAQEEDVVLGRVISVEPGFYGGNFVTRIELKPRRPCGSIDGTQEDREPVTMYLDQYDLTLGQERVCMVRPGFYFPQEGDDLLVLGLMVNPKARILAPANYFQVVDREVRLQPLDFVENGSETRLDELLDCASEPRP
ncbi:MAG: hypothetical protein SX243_11470 [Acidobacteriota bacterium]|nr:hypothetical protein [Acidobacteriota bacterium]